MGADKNVKYRDKCALKVKQWRDEGEIQNECDGPCYKVMLKVERNNCMSYLESAILGKEIIVRFSNKTNEFCLKFKLKGGNERQLSGSDRRQSNGH